MHSELRIGDSLIYVNDPFEDFGTAAPEAGRAAARPRC